MARSESQRNNKLKRWRKIKEQFKKLKDEKTPSGAAPSTASVIEILADDWALSKHTIEEILRKDV